MFVYTDIGNSENKNQLGILDKTVKRPFITGYPEYLKAIKAQKRSQKSF